MWDTHEKESFPSLCAQVAFENAPAPGFYDTGAEQQTTREVARVFRPTTLEELEGGKRRKARRPAPGPHGSSQAVLCAHGLLKPRGSAGCCVHCRLV